MNSTDANAQEAAMGLLSLLSPSTQVSSGRGGSHGHQPLSPHSNGQGSSWKSTVPMKRKISGSGSGKRRMKGNSTGQEGGGEEAIRCICGSTYDDGFSIACDECSRWCHAACFGIVREEVPDEWRCWECDPRAHKQRKRRRRMSSAREHDEEDVVVDIEEPPLQTHTTVPAHANISAPATRARLLDAAQHWRGVSALQPYVPPPPHATALAPLAPHTATVTPPAYTLTTTTPLPASALIAPYTAAITPSAAYVADPLNAYAHLGMPKPFVHLLARPWDIALDARQVADSQGARWVRSGCRPNAVLRPVLCPQSSTDHNPPQDSLGFALFALRDLKAGEEVVLGWEWDDGCVVHQLPAVLTTPGMFPPSHLSHLRAQMANILHSVSSTFPTCACGQHARGCAIRALERFVYGSEHPHDHDHDHDHGDSERRMRDRILDLGPLIGAKRGFRTRERVPGSGGLGGVVVWPYDDDEGRTTREEIVDEEETEDELELPSPDPRKHYPSSHRVGPSRIHMPRGRPPDPPVDVPHAAAVPPRMRKGWMRQAARDVPEDKGACAFFRLDESTTDRATGRPHAAASPEAHHGRSPQPYASTSTSTSCHSTIRPTAAIATIRPTAAILRVSCYVLFPAVHRLTRLAGARKVAPQRDTGVGQGRAHS
ncbi:hypothetical protein H0H87_001732 [Tephrocybe sp. NHM501043]|nr:hypothetical protein H0H87_001732 [Tephrocybe sp. NHM501043]